MAEKPSNVYSSEKKNQPLSIQKSDDSQLHWFWRITTRWYFFPLFYFFLVFILTIILGIVSKNFISNFLLATFFMSDGLLYFVSIIFGIKEMYSGFADTFSTYFPIFFNVGMIISIIVIVYYKLKRNITLKWLIIALILLILISFSGCVINTFINQVDFVEPFM